MNRRVLLWLTAIVLLTTVGCRPRHPPHTPQPLGMLGIKHATCKAPQLIPVTDRQRNHPYVEL